MNAFWIHNGGYFALGTVFSISLFLFNLQFYTGSVKKLGLIINGIKALSNPKAEVLKFSKFYGPQVSDYVRMSTFIHLVYAIPQKTKGPLLYNDG